MLFRSLQGAKGIWPDELPSVLWAYRTTARTPTGETPFRLTYGADAVIPAEIGLTSYRVQNYTEDKNEEIMCLQLDLVDEVQAIAEQRLARYQNLMSKNYDSRVRHRDSRSATWYYERSWALLKTLPRGSSDQIGKDRIESHRGVGRARTTSRPWTEESSSIHGIQSTFGNTTSRSDV